MAKTTIRFTSFPKTEPPPPFASVVVDAFRRHEAAISTVHLKKGLTSNEVLSAIRDELVALGFQVESGKQKG